MNTRALTVWLIASLFLAASQAAPSGLLEIHQINVQQGDCTLIIGPDGTTILIDAGNEGKGTSQVVPYLQSIGIQPADGLDYVIASHRDADHIGGIDEVIGANYAIKKGIWDNGSDKTDGPDGPITKFLAAGRSTVAGQAQGDRVSAITLGHEINLGSGAVAICVAVGGNIIHHGAVSGSLSENDRSIAMLIRFGEFEYLTAGDLGGGDTDRSCTDRNTDQSNCETPLAIALRSSSPPLLSAHGLEVLDVNHHGSESSSNSDYMNLLTPTIAAINTGPGQGSTWHHPRIDVVENVLMAQAPCITAPPALVLQTEEGGPDGSGRSEAGFCVGDIVFKTTGVGTFQVFATGRVSQGPDERAAAGITTSGRTFLLDGATPTAASSVVITEIMPDPESVSDTAGEWFEVHNPGAAPIDINGWTIRDDGNDKHTILHLPRLEIPAGGFLVLGRNGDSAQNGGVKIDYVYSGINLANGSDEIRLENKAGQTVDYVPYTIGWPRRTGSSMSLQSISTDNSVSLNWTLSTTRGGSYTGAGTDFGTPGQ